MYENVGIGVNFKKKQTVINKLHEKNYSKEEILKIMSDKSIIYSLEDGRDIEELLS